MRGAPHSKFSALIRRIRARKSPLIWGRPPKFRDFQRQYRQNPARCQRTRVSGRMILIALRTDGNQRYSRIKNRRSLLVNRTRPRTLRCSTVSCCRSAAFSASSRLLDLKSEATSFNNRNISAAIVADVRLIFYAILLGNHTDEVFGTHRELGRPLKFHMGANGALVRLGV